MILSNLGYFLDNPWATAFDRAWVVDKILTDYLTSQNLGRRPITLIGYSLGARVICSCLIELSRKQQAGLIDNVILLGSPVLIDQLELIKVRSVVSGKFINCFSYKD